jgi:hypothetical protein
MYNVGDYVLYLKHDKLHLVGDSERCEVGRLYKIVKVSHLDYVAYIDTPTQKCYNVYFRQIKHLENNAMNRLLYPEVDWSKYV